MEVEPLLKLIIDRDGKIHTYPSSFFFSVIPLENDRYTIQVFDNKRDFLHLTNPIETLDECLDWGRT